MADGDDASAVSQSFFDAAVASRWSCDGCRLCRTLGIGGDDLVGWPDHAVYEANDGQQWRNGRAIWRRGSGLAALLALGTLPVRTAHLSERDDGGR